MVTVKQYMKEVHDCMNMMQQSVKRNFFLTTINDFVSKICYNVTHLTVRQPNKLFFTSLRQSGNVNLINGYASLQSPTDK